MDGIAVFRPSDGGFVDRLTPTWCMQGPWLVFATDVKFAARVAAMVGEGPEFSSVAAAFPDSPAELLVGGGRLNGAKIAAAIPTSSNLGVLGDDLNLASLAAFARFVMSRVKEVWWDTYLYLDAEGGAMTRSIVEATGPPPTSRSVRGR